MKRVLVLLALLAACGGSEPETVFGAVEAAYPEAADVWPQEQWETGIANACVNLPEAGDTDVVALLEALRLRFEDDGDLSEEGSAAALDGYLAGLAVACPDVASRVVGLLDG